MKKTEQHYSLKNILAKGAHYNVIFGERSNGKTFAVLQYGLEQYVQHGHQMAYIRRWQEDFTGKRGSQLFAGLESVGIIRKLTKGQWTGVRYYASRWYLCRTGEDGKIQSDETPFAFGFSLSAMEHDKSSQYPGITTVFFDEFLTRSQYLTDEFVLFCNVLSTIIRKRDDVRIFMAGNTVTKYCPYFTEMGLSHVKNMRPGTIDMYSYGDSGLTVAVEYAAPTSGGKGSDVYFAFDNPKLNMIKTGAWELAIYPHCPCKYYPPDIVFSYFIYFGGDLLQADVVVQDVISFTFIHRKTTPIKHPDEDLVFCPDWDPRPNWIRKINSPASPATRTIARYYQQDKVFYQDNEVGEVVLNYLKWCVKN